MRAGRQKAAPVIFYVIFERPLSVLSRQSLVFDDRPLMADSGHWIIYNNNLLDSVVMFSTSQLL